ncbi:MAG: hypothetical protein MHPDNHAH_03306 [Anaerolineales bacterium]|nr:hypothetical protein [Anaerolineales bacterium]
MTRVVLDTNVIVSSALGRTLARIFEKWNEGKFIVIVTSDIVSEYFDVINRPKFKLTQTTIDRIGRYIYQFSEFVLPEEQVWEVKADPTDNKFLEAAIAGKADFIISGDKHLLDLKEFRSIPIITALEFMNWLEEHG